jgi:RimJ/RimL family protein N-acetyltransferase
MASFPDLEVPLTDGVVSVRLSAERDIPEILIAYQDDSSLPDSLGEARPPSGAMLGQRSEQAADDLLSGRRATFTILEAGSDTCRGEVRVGDIDWEDHRAALLVWVAPQRRGCGVGRRAHDLVRRWLADTCGLAGDCAAPPRPDLAG